jgi:HEAT repeat protein
MQHVLQSRWRLAGAAVVGAAALLSFSAVGVLAAPYSDPVYDLQQALQVRSKDLDDPAAYKLREATLKQVSQRLRTTGEMRRALSLTGWRDEPGELTPLRVTEKGRSELLVDIDREARKEVGLHFAKQVEEQASRGNVNDRLAVAAMLADMGTSVRSLGDVIEWRGQKYIDWRGFTRRFTPLLVKMTRDPSPAVREAAARALGKINPDIGEAVPALKTMLQKGSLAERRAAAESLGNMVREVGRLVKRGRTQTGVEAKSEEVLEAGEAAAPVAGLAIDDRDAGVRRLGLSSLGESATVLSSLIPEPFDAKDVPPRTGELTPNQIKLVREYTEVMRANEQLVLPLLKAMAAQGNRLARALQDPDAEVRLLARRALESMANSRLRLRRRFESLPRLDNPAQNSSGPKMTGPELIPVGAQEKTPASDEILLKAVKPGLKVFSQRLLDPDPVIRRAAVDFLETLEDAAVEARPALTSALTDPDLFVRWASARALGRINPEAGKSAVPALARLLCDPDLDVRLTAAGTLEAYGTAARAAVPALAEAVRKGDAEFRRAVMFAIQSIGPEDAAPAVPGLIEGLRNQDARVRRTAAETLGRFGSTAASAVPALRQALQDDDADVRQAASDAILSITPAR